MLPLGLLVLFPAVILLSPSLVEAQYEQAVETTVAPLPPPPPPPVVVETYAQPAVVETPVVTAAPPPPAPVPAQVIVEQPKVVPQRPILVEKQAPALVTSASPLAPTPEDPLPPPEPSVDQNRIVVTEERALTSNEALSPAISGDVVVTDAPPVTVSVSTEDPTTATTTQLPIIIENAETTTTTTESPSTTAGPPATESELRKIEDLLVQAAEAPRAESSFSTTTESPSTEGPITLLDTVTEPPRPKAPAPYAAAEAVPAVSPKFRVNNPAPAAIPLKDNRHWGAAPARRPILPPGYTPTAVQYQQRPPVVPVLLRQQQQQQQQQLRPVSVPTAAVIQQRPNPVSRPVLTPVVQLQQQQQQQQQRQQNQPTMLTPVVHRALLQPHRVIPTALVPTPAAQLRYTVFQQHYHPAISQPHKSLYQPQPRLIPTFLPSLQPQQLLLPSARLAAPLLTGYATAPLIQQQPLQQAPAQISLIPFLASLLQQQPALAPALLQAAYQQPAIWNTPALNLISQPQPIVVPEQPKPAVVVAPTTYEQPAPPAPIVVPEQPKPAVVVASTGYEQPAPPAPIVVPEQPKPAVVVASTGYEQPAPPAPIVTSTVATTVAAPAAPAFGPPQVAQSFAPVVVAEPPRALVAAAEQPVVVPSSVPGFFNTAPLVSAAAPALITPDLRDVQQLVIRQAQNAAGRQSQHTIINARPGSQPTITIAQDQQSELERQLLLQPASIIPIVNKNAAA